MPSISASTTRFNRRIAGSAAPAGAQVPCCTCLHFFYLDISVSIKPFKHFFFVRAVRQESGVSTPDNIFSKMENRQLDEKKLSGASEPGSFSRALAVHHDSLDPLSHFRSQFIIPTKSDLRSPTLPESATLTIDSQNATSSELCTYLCGNSLGLQPRRTASRISSFLSQWSTKAVLGHVVEHANSPLAPFLHTDDAVARLMAPIVGAKAEEVAVMGQLTANLHLLLTSFYRPTQDRWKIVLEGKAFPSDHVRVHCSSLF